MRLGKAHDQLFPQQQLIAEASVVALGMVPLWWLTSRFTTSMKWFSDSKPALDVALASFAFHILAEESGVNEWYLTNSYSAQKVFKRDMREGHVSVDNSDLWYSIFMGHVSRDEE